VRGEVSHTARLLLELGGLILLLAVLGRVALKLGLSPIPFYLLGGLAFGDGGLLPLVTSQEFVEIGASLGVILLLLMLGLEYTAQELVSGLRTSAAAGLVNLVLNYTPGVAAGLLLGMGILPSVFLGGVTYITSTGVMAKIMADLGWVANRETPVVLSISVTEDLAMAVALPVLLTVAVGGPALGTFASVAAALALLAALLALGSRYGERIGAFLFSASDEVGVLAVVGITLLVGSAAESLRVSAAVVAFLIGIGLSGAAVGRARRLLTPLRDLFAAVFFVFFGLSTDPGEIPRILLPAFALAAVTAGGKLATGHWAAGRAGLGARARWRAGVALLARGEFSIVIAGLAVAAGAPGRLGALAAAYVLIMATLAPVAARLIDRVPAGARFARLGRRRASPRPS